MRTASDQLLRSAEYRDAGYWGDDTFPQVVDRWADDDPRRRYLSDGTSTLSYGQFRDQAWALAASLAGQGIGRGDRVAIQLPNWNEFFLVYAACARLGAVVIPIAPVYRAGEVGFSVANSGAAAVITCGAFRGFDHSAMAAEIVAACGHRLTQIVVRADPPPGALALDSLLSGAGGVLPGPPSADDPHLVLYSSGTESRPKGCLHTWNTSSFLPKQAIPAMGLTRDDVMFMPAPVTHALGLTLGLMAPTLAGASVELLDIFRPAAALERVTQRGCTGTASPAPLIRTMVDAHDAAGHARRGGGGRSPLQRLPGRPRVRLERGHDGHGLHPGRPDRTGRLLRRPPGPRRRAPDPRRRRGRPGRRGGRDPLPGSRPARRVLGPPGPYRRGPRRAGLVADRGHRSPGRDRLPARHRPHHAHHHHRRHHH